MDMIPPNFRDSIDFRTPPNCAECEFINLQTGMCQKYDYYCSRVLYYRFSGVTYSSCFHVCDMYQPTTDWHKIPKELLTMIDQTIL